MGLWTTAAEALAAARLRRAVARRLTELDRTPRRSLRDEIEEWAAAAPTRPILAGADGERLTAADLAGRAVRWTRWTILHGVERGEPVALLMADRPERVAAWLGVAAAGAVAAPLDPAANGADLAAALAALAPRHVIVDAALLPHFEAAAPHLTVTAAVWIHGPHAMAYPRIDEALDELSPERLRPADRRPIAADAVALCFPSPVGIGARLTHRRVVRRLHAVAAACALRADDRLDLRGLASREAATVLAVAPASVGALALLGAPTAPRPSRPATIVAWDTAPDGTAPGGDRSRRGLAIGRNPATARSEAARLGVAHHLLLCDGDLLTAAGTLLWRDPPAAPPSVG